MNEDTLCRYYRSVCSRIWLSLWSNTVDYFPKYVGAVHIRQKPAVETANFLFSLVCHYYCSDICITNKGREFINKLDG